MANWQSLYDAGYSAACNCDVELAEDYLSKAIAEAEKNKSDFELAKSLNALAVVFQMIGRSVESRSMFTRVSKLKIDEIERGNAYSGLGQICSMDEDFSTAIDYFGKALEVFCKLDSRLDILDVENQLIQTFPSCQSFVESQPVSDELKGKFEEAQEFANNILSVDNDMSCMQVIEQIDKHIDETQDEVIDNLETMDKHLKSAFDIAILWGNQLVKSFGWQWRIVSVSGTGEILCVISDDNSQVVYPVNFISECIQDPELDCTIMLAFNMLSEGMSQELKPDEYENIMEMVFRVVPKEGKTRSLAASRLPNM